MASIRLTSRKPRLHVFIDASNVWEAQKAKGYVFEYSKLVNYLSDKFGTLLVKVFYYTAYPEDGTRDYDLDGKHRFFVYLEKRLGFIVRKKPLKRIRIDNGCGEIKFMEKGNMDVEMTIDAVHHKEDYDIAVLFTGDSDFLALVNYLRGGGKKVYAFSSEKNISKELRTGGDGYLDLLKIDADIWGHPLVNRPEGAEKE